MALDLHIGLRPEHASLNEPVSSFALQEFGMLTDFLKLNRPNSLLWTRLGDYYADAVIPFSETVVIQGELREMRDYNVPEPVQPVLAKLELACEYARNHSMNIYAFCD